MDSVLLPVQDRFPSLLFLAADAGRQGENAESWKLGGALAFPWGVEGRPSGPRETKGVPFAQRGMLTVVPAPVRSAGRVRQLPPGDPEAERQCHC
eukprot:scaffold1944_cov241-Pinguiococcus_pyrenoidosus.AAC.14